MNYILIGHDPIVEHNVRKWRRWFASAERLVDRTAVKPGVDVSTVFVGVDYDFGIGKPALFETMIFGGERDAERHRYSSWDEAQQGHHRIVDSFAERIVGK